MAKIQLPETQNWLSNVKNSTLRLPHVKNSTQRCTKINSQRPLPVFFFFSARTPEICPVFLSIMEKSEKIGYNLNKIEICSSIIAIIFQIYGSKSPHSLCQVWMNFTTRAQNIGSQRPQMDFFVSRNCLKEPKVESQRSKIDSQWPINDSQSPQLDS